MPCRITKEKEKIPGLKSYDFVIISETMSEKIKPVETKIKNFINECKDIESALAQLLNDTPAKIIYNDIPCDSADYHYIEELLKKVRKVRAAIKTLSGSG